MIKDCKEIRKNILTISSKSGHGHIPSCFSVVEVLYSIYSVMRNNPSDPGWPERDIFILSKGHAALAHYCVLAFKGYFDVQKVYSFGGFGSDFGCHADCSKIPGVEVSTGSLGHGIGLAVGMALAFKIDGLKRDVYCVIGDGESNEGSVWEAIMVAASLKLGNLTVVYDNNTSQTRGLQIVNPYEKLKAFGFDAVQVNGHDVGALSEALKRQGGMPRAIVANTVKGYGCRTLSDNFHEWHRKAPKSEELNGLIGELDA